METIQKRLHISGLTPAITENDIRTRLQNFVNVTVIDGFGKLNAIGEPRKFAYATVDATEHDLARCLNHLSGTVWKGAKLRIGEAKPDYTQRLVKERQQETQILEEGNLKKRQRLLKGVQGIHAKEMSPVTLENVDSRPGWQKTTLSHLIRPMKIRPPRPLPVLSDVNSKGSAKAGKRKALHGPSRATIQKIDPRCWGAVHITENMLQSIVIAPSAPIKQRVAPEPKSSTATSLKSSSPTLETSPNNSIAPATHTETQQTLKGTKIVSETLVDTDIQRENSGHLTLLTRMFGELSDEWGGPEYVDSNSETEDENNNDTREQNVIKSPEHPKKIQDVSLSKSISNSLEKESNADVMMEDVPGPDSSEINEKTRHTSSPAPEVSSQTHKSKEKSLKDLFKPQEDVGFSLMAGFDLDLDLELDPAFDFSKPTETQVTDFTPAQTTSEPSTSLYHHEGFTLDPRLPLFFPQPGNPRSKDLLTIAETQGWQFHRTDDSETIRKQWDDAKGELTREWKKRSREAVKARRRRFGAEAIEE